MQAGTKLQAISFRKPVQEHDAGRETQLLAVIPFTRPSQTVEKRGGLNPRNSVASWPSRGYPAANA